MISRNVRNKKILSVLALTLFIAIIALLIQTSLSGLQRFVIGPLRAIALGSLGALLLLVLDMRANDADRTFLTDWVFILTGGILLGITTAVSHFQPQAAHAGWLQWGWFPAILLILTGAGLRLREKISFGSRELSRQLLLILTLVFIFLSLLPVLSSGFYWDDAILSARIPSLKISGGSIWQYTMDEIIQYSQRGRINPFATFQFLVFYLFPDARVYKLLLVVLTILDAFLFYKLIGRLFKGNPWLGFPVLLLLPLCFQLRIYHDPLMGYYGLMQMMLAELIGSLILFDRYLESGKKRQLAGSLLLYLVGLMSYEMFYPFILLILLFAWNAKKKIGEALKASLPHLIAVLGLLGVSFGFRWSYAATGQMTYQGTNFSLDVGRILTTWFHQTLAAFPLNYQLAGNDGVILKELIPAGEIFSQTPGQFFMNIHWSDILLICLFLVIVRTLAAHIHLPKIGLFHWLFGLGLLLLSGLVIALSEKYQEQILAGLGYLPVYFGYFSAAWLIFCLAVLLYKIFRRHIRKEVLVSIGLSAFTLVFLLNQQSNRRVVTLMNQTFLYPRNAGEAALQSGILQQLDPEKDVLITNHAGNLWESGWKDDPLRSDFVALNSGTLIRTFSPAEIWESAAENGQTDDVLAFSDTYVLEYDAQQTSGFAKLGHLVESGLADDGVLDNPIVNDLYFFVTGDCRDSGIITWTTWDGGGHSLPVRDTWLQKKTASGCLYKLDDARTILFDSIGLTRYQ